MERTAFRQYFIFCLYSLLVSISAMPLMAGVDEGTANVEIYLGSYYPDDPYDNDLSFGIRGGGLLSERFGLQGTVGYFDSHSGCCSNGIDYSSLFTDISAIWYVNPRNLAVFMVYGGSGLNWSSLKADVVDTDKLSVSFHGGLGLNIALGEVVYLRPDTRLHWISEGTVYDGSGGDIRVTHDAMVDFEASLALGFTFGR